MTSPPPSRPDVATLPGSRLLDWRADGAVEQHVHQVVLMEQVSVADPGRLIADLLRGTEVRVTAMASVSSSMR